MFPQVPGYEILRELGRGGMGVVYQARQLALNRLVALKMIRTADLAGPEELERFRIEAEAVARMQHPNIVQIYEIGAWQAGDANPPMPYFSLEFCDGGDLKGRVGNATLGPHQAARVVETLARAMHAAHQRGIVHRDLKPQNILLVGGPDVPIDGCIPKITDFGLAKRLETTGQTRDVACMGTPSYMPPEQAEGRSKEVGAAADIYSLGATLYALVAGRPPFVGASNQDILMQVMLDEPVPPRQLNPQVPRDLETIALKCLDKEPSRRYASAEALADDLRRFLQHEPIAARPVGQLERGWRWCRRKPALAASLAGTVLALVLGTVVSAVLAVRANFHAGRAESARQVAETKTEVADAARAEAVEEKNKADAARRHAEKLAYVGQLGLAQREWQDGQCAHARNLLEDCAPELRGWEHNYLYSLFHQNQRTFRGHIDQVTSVAWSPDGQRLASTQGTGR